MASTSDGGHTTHDRERGHDRALTAGLLVLLGLVLIAHPLYLWPHYGQTNVGVYSEEVTDPPADFVAFEQLPPGAQSVVQAEVANGGQVLWTGEDDRVIDALDDGVIVRYQDTYYQVILTYGHGGGFIPVLLRWLLTAASAFLIVYGGLVLHTGTWRPFTPLRSLLAPVTVTLGFLATAYYDVTFSGVSGSFFTVTGGLPGLSLIEVIPITSLFLAVGSAAAIHGVRSRLVRIGTVGALVLVLARYVPTHPVALLVLVLYTAIGGLPWLGLGYRLTESP